MPAPFRTGRLASHFARWRESDLLWSFRRSKLTMGAALVALALIAAALLAPWITQQNPFDPAQLDLLNAELPPAWTQGGDPRFILGTDGQGRDMLAAVLYGARISLIAGFASVALAALLGIVLGLCAGYFGGIIDVLVMRAADVQLSFPAILIALLIAGIVQTAVGGTMSEPLALGVVVLAIAASGWVQYARTVRGSTLVERGKDYVLAARVIGVHPFRIMLTHVLPNVLGPVTVIATIHLALAVITEATLSFLGVGVPATMPSLGTLIRIGNAFLFSGQWWITVFPGVTLVALTLSVNLVGDWLRDALNPRLR